MKGLVKRLVREKLEGIIEDINVPIEIGDEILGGKFKNKKTIVKTIGKNDKGDITINDKPLLKFRIIKDLKEDIEAHRINDIDSDELYDSILTQALELSKTSEIGFGSAEPFGVIIDDDKLAGATWIESSGNFTFHIIIKPEYRGKGLSKLLLDDLMKKYIEKKGYMGKNYKVVVNVVNDKLASTLAKNYGFKTMEDNGQGGIIMTN
jgi:GNAT superfamily N-acetyltransferase